MVNVRSILLTTNFLTHLPIVSNQQVVGIYLIAKDVTSVVQSQHELQQQRVQIDAHHRKMVSILESITDGFFAVDRNWMVTYWNGEAERILELPRELIEGKNFWEAYREIVPAASATVYQRAMDNNVSMHRENYYDRLGKWLEVSAFPSEDGLSLYFKDITARKQADEKLSVGKQQYQELFNRSPLPQWVYDLEDYAFKDINLAAIAHYGYSKSDFLSMTIKDIRPVEDITLLETLVTAEVKKAFSTGNLIC